MSKSWAEIVAEAGAMTDAELSNTISSMSRLTEQDIQRIAPNLVNKQDLLRVMSIVQDSTKSNQEKASAIQNIAGAVEIVSMLLQSHIL